MGHASEKGTSPSAVVVGLALVAAGTLWVLHNFGVIDVPIRRFWPLILVAVGVAHLAGARSLFNMSGWFLMLLGGAFLCVTNGLIGWSDLWRFSPIALIFIGLFVIFGFMKRGKQQPAMPRDGDEDLDVSVLFGGVERRVNTPTFRGGRIQAIFGGGEVDLRDSGLHEEGAIIEVNAIFGGVEIYLPREWSLQVQANAMFGGVENKTANPSETRGCRLVVKASAIMGGVELKN